MSDEKTDNKPVEKPNQTKPQETSKETKPQEKDVQGNLVELRESFAGKSGDQGVFLQPVGSHDTDPFVAQDITQPQPTSSQQVVTSPLSSVQSSGNDSDSEE